jgi:hypothetical protein
VEAAFRRDLERAAHLHAELGEVIDDSPNSRWAMAARARQGTLFEACRRGLEDVSAPHDRAFADKRERLIEEADGMAARRYVEALLGARKFGAYHEEVGRGVARLAVLADRHGEAYVRALTRSVMDSSNGRLQCPDRSFVHCHPGKLLEGDSGDPLPLPVDVK